MEQPHVMKPGTISAGLGAKEKAEQLISNELSSILRHDAFEFPIGKKEKKKRKDRKRNRTKMEAESFEREGFELEEIEVMSVKYYFPQLGNDQLFYFRIK